MKLHISKGGATLELSQTSTSYCVKLEVWTLILLLK